MILRQQKFFIYTREKATFHPALTFKYDGFPGTIAWVVQGGGGWVGVRPDPVQRSRYGHQLGQVESPGDTFDRIPVAGIVSNPYSFFTDPNPALFFTLPEIIMKKYCSCRTVK